MKTSNEEKDQIEAIENGVADPRATPSGRISTLTCPECGGTLWEQREGNVLRYLCHTGHGFSAHSLMEAEDKTVETALWVALRALKERAMLMARFAAKAHAEHRPHTAKRYSAEERDLRDRIELVRNVLVGNAPRPAPAPRSKRRNARPRAHPRRRTRRR